MRRIRAPVWIAALAAALLVAALSGPVALAQTSPEPPPPPLDEILEQLDAVATSTEAVLSADAADAVALGRLRETMTDQRAVARELVARLSDELTPLQAQLDALGPAPEEGFREAPEISLRRAELAERVVAAEGRLRSAEFAETRADTLLASLAQRQRDVLSDELLARGPIALSWETWSAALREAPALGGRFIAGVRDAARDVGWPLALIFTFAVVGFLYALATRPRSVAGGVIDYLVARVAAAREPGAKIFYGFCLFFVRVAPLAFIVIMAAEALVSVVALTPAGEMFVRRLTEGAVIVIVTSAVARTLFSPRLPDQRVIPVADAEAVWAWARVTLLAALICGGRLVIDVAEEADARLAFLTVVNLIFVALSAPLIYALAVTLCRPRPTVPTTVADDDAGDDPDGKDEGGAITALASFGRLAGLAVAVVTPIIAAIGYFPLSRFLLERSALTVALFVMLGLAFVIVKRILQGPIQEPHPSDAMTASATADGTADAAPPPPRRARGLAPAMTAILLAIVGAPLLAGIWGATPADLRVMAVDLIEGVEIGETTYSILDLLIAIAVFVLGLWITRFLQRILRRDVLPNTSLDRGVQSSLAAGLGYVGFFVTVLLTVSAVGMDLSNIAIVAGALSVGIGFGLQNIVNNFVSGLILLVERPIKVGDWIVAGGHQGYVRRINVRATEIETFDRASVIVPNSELISSAVTNWTHKSATGRVIARVGVSYDADAERVTQILREIGGRHPMALRYPAPFVYFAGFGDNALDFELRVMIRDVNYMLSVHHELNLAIHKRFRDEGIEIPYPQRDLHLRTPAMLNGAGDVVAAVGPVATHSEPSKPTEQIAANPAAKPAAEDPR